MRFLLFLLCSLSIAANAGVYRATGEVHDILVRAGSDYHSLFYIKGFNTAGNCYSTASGVVIIVEDLDFKDKSEQSFSLLLASYMSGKQVSIRVDDTIKDADGRCIAQDVRLNIQP